MDRELAFLRSRVEAERSRGAGTGTRYPAELRRRIVDFVQHQQATGLSVGRATRLLGLNELTVRGWLERGQEKSGFRRVEVASADRLLPGAQGLVVFAGPLRIEGLGLPDLVELVRALG